MEGLTVCTKHDVTGNGHTDVTTMGFTHMQTEVRRGLTKDLARDEQQHRPQLDLAGLGEKPWCMCVYIGV